MTLSWLLLNSRLLLLKCMALAFRATPFRKSFIALAGYAAGITLAAIKPGRLEKYREAVAPESPLWIFACRYYSRLMRDRFWSNVLCGDPGNLRSYFSDEGSDLVRRALEEGRGAIILGYHYGPPFTFYLLRELCSIPARFMIHETPFNKLRSEEKLAVKSLLTAKRLYLADSDIVIPRKHTLKTVKHLRQGGAVLMLNDGQSWGKGVMAMDFLGRTLDFSYFPFKVSLKYSAPLFFCVLRDDGAGGYRLVFVPWDAREGVEGGLKSYLALISAQIKSSPLMWYYGADFSSWPEARKRADSGVTTN